MSHQMGGLAGQRCGGRGPDRGTPSRGPGRSAGRFLWAWFERSCTPRREFARPTTASLPYQAPPLAVASDNNRPSPTISRNRQWSLPSFGKCKLLGVSGNILDLTFGNEYRLVAGSRGQLRSRTSAQMLQWFFAIYCIALAINQPYVRS